MGALIAALYATGATADEVDDRVFDEFVRRRPFGDFRPSLTSLAKGERGNAMLRRCFGDSRLEELAARARGGEHRSVRTRSGVPPTRIDG